MLDLKGHTAYYLSNKVFSAIYVLCGETVCVYVLDNKLLDGVFKKNSLSEFDGTVARKLFSNNNRILSTINIEVTNFCNLQCIHCYADMHRGKGQVMPYSSVSHYVSEIQQLGIPINIKLSGGEPSLNTEIVDICAAIQTIKPLTAHKLLTNFTMPSETLKGIIETGISLQISIYGCSFEEFHRFTNGTKLQYDTIINNLKSIPQEFANNTHIVFHVPKFNKETSESCKQFADSFGLTYHIGGINYIGRAYINNSVLEAKNSQNSEAYPKMFLCNRICENTKVCISTRGEVTPCPFFRPDNDDYVIGDLNTLHLKDILQSDKLKIFDNLSIDDVAGCKNCPLRYVCSGGCSAERLTMTGSILKKYPRCTVNEDFCKLDNNCVYQVSIVKPGFFKFNKGGVIQ